MYFWCMIKHTLKLLCLTLVLTALTGCPYGTEITLDGAEKINSAYLGKYEKQNSSYYYLVVSKYSDNEYKLEKYRTTSETVKETGIGRVFDIKGTKFIVVKKHSSSSSSYYKKKQYIYKFMPSKSGYIMKLQGVSDYIDEEFETSEELKKYLEKYKDLSFFYQKKVDKYYKSDDE